MLVYYFVPFIVSNPYLLFWVTNGHNSVTVQNRTHVYMNFFDHKDLGNHLLQLCPKVVKYPVCVAQYSNLTQNLSLSGFINLVSSYIVGFPKQGIGHFVNPLKPKTKQLTKNPNVLPCLKRVSKICVELASGRREYVL